VPDQRTFRVSNDQTGETKEITHSDLAELQAQGWRIDDVAGFQEAQAQAQQTGEDRMEAEAKQREKDDAAPMAAQTREDATATAEATYPQVKGSSADKPASSSAKVSDVKTQEPKKPNT
jgi:hypothetical protein